MKTPRKALLSMLCTWAQQKMKARSTAARLSRDAQRQARREAHYRRNFLAYDGGEQEEFEG